MTLDRTLGDRRVRATVCPASPAWPVEMLIRVEIWWPGWYMSKYCESAEEAEEVLHDKPREERTAPQIPGGREGIGTPGAGDSPVVLQGGEDDHNNQDGSWWRRWWAKHRDRH
ncbi:hypothetical protein GAG84_27710 [Bacteroides thetaiotaomicron]|nr:hypothetical protein GAG84_27710 [Bacteroides thetaiotaomicron]